MEKLTLTVKEQKKRIDIYAGMGIIKSLSELLSERNIHKTFVLSSDKVWTLWGKTIEKALNNNFGLFLLPDGEAYKNIAGIEKIYNALTEEKATRTTALIAIGGGVIGDMGAFAASTYHRGMPLVHVPTTLLAQVDSSIGGKTGFNLDAGKNLVGSFYHPLFVLADAFFLSTLPEKESLSGLSEAIKAGLIRDKALFELMEKNVLPILSMDKKLMMEIIKAAQKVKIDVVQRDEKESGLRAILNFGHTLGHAVEKLYNWKILHGEAVSIGMGFASYLSYYLGYLSERKLLRILELIKECSLPLTCSFPPDKIIEAVYYDKKRKEALTEWVVLKDIGRAAYGEKLKDETIRNALDGYKEYIRRLSQVTRKH